jgi:hypothetical protein
LGLGAVELRQQSLPKKGKRQHIQDFLQLVELVVLVETLWEITPVLAQELVVLQKT